MKGRSRFKKVCGNEREGEKGGKRGRGRKYGSLRDYTDCAYENRNEDETKVKSWRVRE